MYFGEGAEVRSPITNAARTPLVAGGDLPLLQDGLPGLGRPPPSGVRPFALALAAGAQKSAALQAQPEVAAHPPALLLP
jgi:hypothetical protein